MNYETACAPCTAPCAVPISWKGYLNNENDEVSQLSSFQAPVSEYSEMVFEKKEEEEDIFSFMQEDATPYSEDYFNGNFEFANDAFTYSENQVEDFFPDDRSDCSKNQSELENGSSISTDLGYDMTDICSNAGSDMFSSYMDEGVMLEDAQLEAELTNKSRAILQHRSHEEKNYLDKVWPFLLASLKDAFRTNNLPLTDNMVSSLLEQLLHSKQVMLGAERLVLDSLVKEEVSELSYERPDEMITTEELNMNTRKEKKATKGNKNTSALNHLNENYVSNIFQFAKRNYPEDKNVQRIGNERNISASNFRKIMQPKMNDDIMMRKARARINASGAELVGNIEYWMRDGYFDQCADRQKYLCNKEKALRDLALSGQY